MVYVSHNFDVTDSILIIIIFLIDNKIFWNLKNSTCLILIAIKLL